MSGVTVDHAEHERRLTAVRAALEARGLDALLAWGPPEQPGAVTYLTGYEPVFVPAWCVVTADACLLLASSLEWAASNGGAREEWVEVRRPHDPFAAIREAIAGASRVGLANWEYLPAPYAVALDVAPEGGRIAPTDALDEVRLIKSPIEIAAMREAARVADAGVAAFAAAVAAGGLTEVEVAKAVEGAMRDAGLEHFANSTVLAAGKHGADVTMAPRNTPIAPGDLVMIDNSCRLHGYCADMARAAVKEEPSPELARMLETAVRMYEEGRALLRPGADGNDAHRRAQEIAEEAGYEYPYGTGHSLGCDFHEGELLIGVGDGPVPLAEDMVVCIEPGLYVPGLGGLRLENVIHITAEGPVELTRSPLQLW